jgi:Spy/CpxP family protein refolding chaperone
MHPKFVKIIAGVVLFASGAVVGVVGSRLLGERGPLAIMHGDPRHFAAMALRRITSDLDLSQEQQDKLRPIIMDTTRQIIALRREQEPRMRELIETSKELTKALLTPEQREKFADVMARLEARRKVLDRFGPPPPDGFGPPPPPDGFDPHGGPPPPPPDLFDPEWDLPPPPPPGGFGPPPDGFGPPRPGGPGPGFGPPPRRDAWPEKKPRPDGVARPADKTGADKAVDSVGKAGPGDPPPADSQGRTPPPNGDAPSK